MEARRSEAKSMNYKIVSTVEAFHPAIAKAILGAGAEPEKVLVEFNAVLSDYDAGAEQSGKTTSKTGAKEKPDTRTVSLKAKGNLPKTPLGQLVRINDYLWMARELYTKVEAIELPLSVLEFIRAERFKAVDALQGEEFGQVVSGPLNPRPASK